MADDDRERLNALAYEAQVLQSQGQGVGEQIAALNLAQSQIHAAMESLKCLKDGKGGSSYVPVGAGVLAPASISAEIVVVEVGAGVLVEKSREEAIALLEKRLRETGEAQEHMQKGALRLNQRLRALDTEARGLVERMRGQGAEE